MICCMYCFPLGGSARESKVLLELIPVTINGGSNYNIDKDSASYDPQVTIKGSAACFPSIKEILPERQEFCWP